mmetsp:Transcript_23076/g.87274  ORF Transcript_23076/g.87274 Transcript_23076/m.87274 type:complete len:365 (+) Transcript_23076:207-1301(+)
MQASTVASASSLVQSLRGLSGASSISGKASSTATTATASSWSKPAQPRSNFREQPESLQVSSPSCRAMSSCARSRSSAPCPARPDTLGSGDPSPLTAVHGPSLPAPQPSPRLLSNPAARAARWQAAASPACRAPAAWSSAPAALNRPSAHAMSAAVRPRLSLCRAHAPMSAPASLPARSSHSKSRPEAALAMSPNRTTGIASPAPPGTSRYVGDAAAMSRSSSAPRLSASAEEPAQRCGSLRSSLVRPEACDVAAACSTVCPHTFSGTKHRFKCSGSPIARAICCAARSSLKCTASTTGHPLPARTLPRTSPSPDSTSIVTMSECAVEFHPRPGKRSVADCQPCKASETTPNPRLSTAETLAPL